MNDIALLQQKIATLRSVIASGYGRTNKPIPARRLATMLKQLEEMEKAAGLWDRADRDGGVSMADYRTIAANAIAKVLKAKEGRQP